MTDTEAGLLRAVCENPDDDLPRLVFADWLTENAGEAGCWTCRGSLIRGQLHNPYPGGWSKCGTCFGSGRMSDGRKELAEFVRVQIEIARLVKLGAHEGRSCNVTGQCSECHREAEVRALRERERELWASRGDRPIQHPCQWFDVPGWACMADIGKTRLVWTLPDYSEVIADVRRGFLEEVTCTLAQFFGGPCGWCDGTGQAQGSDRPFQWSGPGTYPGPCPARCDKGRTPGIAPRLFACQPVTRVTLSDREPYSNVFGWYDAAYPGLGHPSADASLLPTELFNKLPVEGRHTTADPTGERTGRRDYWSWWLTRDAAMDALSAACVSYGRANAEGMTHEVACDRCKGEGWYDRNPGDGEMSCLDCGGKGTIRRPGLPPLAPTVKETHA